MKRIAAFAALIAALAAPIFASETITLAAGGTLGTDKGGGANGVLVGALTATAVTKAIVRTVSADVACALDDGGLYAGDTTDCNDVGTADIAFTAATPADDDAFYIGRVGKKFSSIDITISTAGNGTWTVDWEYWDGDSWAALADVVDGTTAWEAAAGVVVVSFTQPVDWAANTVDSVLAYWVRSVIDDYSATTTAPVGSAVRVVGAVADADFTDDTTDANSAGAADVALLPATLHVGDAFFVGYTAKFPKVRVTTSTARTGTATIQAQFWNGTAWAAITGAVDDTAGFSTTAGVLHLHFEPPATWTANTTANGPNAQAGYFIGFVVTAVTTYTAAPVGTQAWIYPMVTGAIGVPIETTGVISEVTMSGITLSGTTADSKFVLINVTTGAFVPFTWTKATSADVEVVNNLPVTEGNEVVLIQIQEDATTEFANTAFYLKNAF